MSRNLFYIYGIAQEQKAPIIMPSNGTGKLDRVRYKELAAYFSLVSESEFSEKNIKVKLQDAQWVKNKILNHERVLETIMARGAVIPMKFGCLFKTAKRIEMLLKENFKNWATLLEHLKDKEEWAVKFYCDRNLLMKKFLDSTKEKRLESVPLGVGEGARYLLAQRVTQEATKEFEEVILKIAQDFHLKAASYAENSSINAIPPRELTQKKNSDVILNAAYLVAKNKRDAFVENIKRSRGGIGNGFEITVTGPYPPYCFTQISIDLRGSRESANC